MTTSPASFASSPLDELVAANLAALRQRIAASGRDPTSVRVVAVTKGFDATYVRAALRAGLGHIGENYANEFLAKRSAVPEELCWHFLGALQTNKIPALARVTDVFAAVCRRREIDALARQDRHGAIDIQVDFTSRTERNGARLDDVVGLVSHARAQGIAVRGLMTVAPTEPRAARDAFTQLARMADSLELIERSMGMSDDLELACEAGTTEIRVGRALFGARPGR